MALQGKFLKFCNVWNTYRNVFQTKSWNTNNVAGCQQIAGLRRQTIEEKYNLPIKPKRPLTPYFRYMMKIRPDLKREMPNAKITDLVRETALRWEKVDQQLKEKLEAEYKKDQDVYAKERLNFDTNLTDEQKNAIKQARIDHLETKEKREHKKKCKENNKPKKASSAFVIYMKTQLPNRGTKPFKTFLHDMGEAWSKLSEKEKKPFIDEMHVQMKEYQKNMVEWERKMIKLGNTDIVRQDALIEPNKTKSTKKVHHKKE